MLMIHGEGDTLVPLSQSEHMLDAAKKAGVEGRLVKVENANHDFQPVDETKPIEPNGEEIHRMTIELFENTLR